MPERALPQETAPERAFDNDRSSSAQDPAKRGLVCAKLDLNDPANVHRLVEAVRTLADRPRHHLEVRSECYFTTPGASVPACAGWYVIFEQESHPIYVGMAENLDRRLNSNNGSLDNFANPKRTSDARRNFIKHFRSTHVFTALTVITISEPDLCNEIGLSSPLTKVDRQNVEKVLDLFRFRMFAARKPRR